MRGTIAAPWLTLESPQEFAQWPAQALAEQEHKAQQQAARNAEAAKGRRSQG